MNFEAVDYETSVWVNGRLVGGHKGGFNPWRVEITNVVYGDMTVSSAEGTHEVVVRVIDPTDGSQLRGKQVCPSTSHTLSPPPPPPSLFYCHFSVQAPKEHMVYLCKWNMADGVGGGSAQTTHSGSPHIL